MIIQIIFLTFRKKNKFEILKLLAISKEISFRVLCIFSTDLFIFESRRLLIMNRLKVELNRRFIDTFASDKK